MFALYTSRQGKARYAEKTPINVLHIELLADVFPEARFIHLIRDGRDVALSYLDTDFGASSLPEAAVQWRRFVRKGRRSGARVGAHRYQEVRYEDLVADPDTVLRSLCEFIDLPFDPSMLRYHERAGSSSGTRRIEPTTAASRCPPHRVCATGDETWTHGIPRSSKR